MNGRRILVSGGMLLLLGGVIYAAVYLALFSQSLGKLQSINLELALDMSIKGQAEMARSYAREFDSVKRRQLLHWLVSLHFMMTGLSALAISSFIMELELKKKWEKILSYLLIFGGVLTGFGFIMQSIGYGFYGWGISLLGYMWLLIGIGGYAVLLALHVIVKPEL